MEHIDQTISRICQSCGFCCNGVLFTRVPLTDEDALLKTAESRFFSLTYQTDSDCPEPSEAFRGQLKEAIGAIEHPCPFYRKSCCKVYSKRPTLCREYECRLILQIRSGALSVGAAHQVLAEAKESYGLLNEMFGGASRQTGFWPRMRRLVRQDTADGLNLTNLEGVDPKTLPFLQVFVSILEAYFHPTSVEVELTDSGETGVRSQGS